MKIFVYFLPVILMSVFLALGWGKTDPSLEDGAWAISLMWMILNLTLFRKYLLK
jgi:hypothetical protein